MTKFKICWDFVKVHLMISLVCTMHLDQFYPLLPNSLQTCTIAWEIFLFSTNDLDLDLYFHFSTWNLVHWMISPVCTTILEQIDPLISLQSSNIAADRTLSDMNDLDIGLDLDSNTFNDSMCPWNISWKHLSTFTKFPVAREGSEFNMTDLGLDLDVSTFSD